MRHQTTAATASRWQPSHPFGRERNTKLGKSVPQTILLAGFIGLMTASTSSIAESVFGIGIGEAFNVPACSQSGAQDICYEDKGGRGDDLPWGEKAYFIRIPYESMPWAIRQSGFQVDTYNNEVVSIGIVTYGEQSQEAVFRDLKAKFGKPRSNRTDHLQNRFGARFHGIRAWWDRPNCKVEFNGIDGEIDYGSISIDAKSANAREAAIARKAWKNNDKKPPSF